MRKWLFVAVAFPCSINAAEFGFQGDAQIQQRAFFQSPQPPEHEKPVHWQGSVMLAPEWYWQAERATYSFKPFARVDSHDEERSHIDIRELIAHYFWDDYELKVGVGKVFWGVLESQHIVDVINQTDLVEAFDQEEKLGQPMMQFKLVKDYGTLELFALPYFRERTFPGSEGRLSGIEVNPDAVRYESGNEENHLDVAMRYSHYIDSLEFAASYFKGTNRDPYLMSENSSEIPEENTFLLIPFYAQMSQASLDMLVVQENWLYKFEGRYRDSLENTWVLGGGFEYTQVGVFSSLVDFGWLVELIYDQSMDKDLEKRGFAGIRINFNDVDGTEVLVGVDQSLKRQSETLLRFESSQRINERWKWQLEAWFISSQQSASSLFPIENEDFIELSLNYYF